MIRTAKIMAVLGLLALCGTAWGVEPIPNLISHWKFDEGNGTTAYDSVGDNDGNLIGDPNWVTGKVGTHALDFDGVDDYVDLDDHIGDYQDLSTGTLSVWIKKESTGNSGMFFSSSDGGDFYSSMYFAKMADEKIKIRISKNNTSKLYWRSDSIVPFGWHHFAYTTSTNPSGNWMYLDGELVTGDYTVGSPSTSAFFSHIPDQDTMRIGNLHNSNKDSWHWDGLIDDVRIYDRALSAEEVQQLYQGEMVELEIIGPNEVAENFSASYKAIAHYDNNSTKDVTDSADWQVEPNVHASIETGLLTTEEIYVPQEDITIYAQYTGGEVTVEAEKEVLVFAICPSGSALSFDGDDDYVDCGNDESLDITETMTISAWVKPSGSIAVTAHRFFGRGYYNNSSDSKYLILFYNYELNEFGYKIRHDENPKLITCPGVKGAWQHIVATYDSGTMKLYINGEYAAGTTGADLQSDISNYNLTIGAGISQTLSFNGVIDEVAIYNRVLSAEEIQANMHTRLSGDEPGLVGYWDFDEGEEQVAYDLSPYGNHGQLGSTPDADASDPAWVNSDAPIGICTLEELVERNLSDVLDIKLDILEQLGIAVAKEKAVVDMLNTFFKNRDFGSAKKKDVGKVKKKIHSAIKHEKKSKKELEKSIEGLEDALVTLGQ